jgi:signal transduction histidine kinase
VSVSDDGRGGTDPERGPACGLADRVEAAGGRLEVETRLGEGTRVRATFPQL